jgi:hypothetical protein
MLNILPLQVKNKPQEGDTNVRLFLGLLAWLQTSMFKKIN